MFSNCSNPIAMRNKKRPSVDIILCSYNQEEYISQALESLVNQRVDADVRVIVADDCSTDQTPQIIHEYQAKSPFPFIYLKANSNIGMKANYRRAFAACQGDYVAILEGDDWWHASTHLSQHIDFLESHPRYSMSYNLVAYYWQDTGATHPQQWLYKDLQYLSINLRQQIAWGNQIGNLSSCMFRTRLLHTLPEAFYQLNFADWELGIMMARKGPIAMLREVTSTYRINSKGQWTSLSNEKKYDSQIQSLDDIQPLLPAYCKCYIRSFQKNIRSGKEMPYVIPFKYKLKSFIRKNLRHSDSKL